MCVDIFLISISIKGNAQGSLNRTDINTPIEYIYKLDAVTVIM